MSPQQSVLIVDPSSESREVLRAALGRAGTRVLEAARPDEGLEIAARDQPDLIVLDLESADASSSDCAGEFGAATEESSTPIVVLAAARRQAARLPTGEFVAKPYHYGPLVHRIEELLARRSRRAG